MDLGSGLESQLAESGHMDLGFAAPPKDRLPPSALHQPPKQHNPAQKGRKEELPQSCTEGWVWVWCDPCCNKNCLEVGGYVESYFWVTAVLADCQRSVFGSGAAWSAQGALYSPSHLLPQIGRYHGLYACAIDPLDTEASPPMQVCLCLSQERDA